MLKSCKYCGRIHDSKYDCGKKPKRISAKKKDSTAAQFRRTQAWKDKSLKIRERDHYLCQCCIRNMKGTKRRLNHDGISVHHIIPIEEDFDKRLDDENLISVCGTHHEMAENGQIAREELMEIVKEHPPGV